MVKTDIETDFHCDSMKHVDAFDEDNGILIKVSHGHRNRIEFKGLLLHVDGMRACTEQEQGDEESRSETWHKVAWESKGAGMWCEEGGERERNREDAQ